MQIIEMGLGLISCFVATLIILTLVNALSPSQMTLLMRNAKVKESGNGCVPSIPSRHKIVIGDAQIDLEKYKNWGDKNEKIPAGAVVIKVGKNRFRAKRRKVGIKERLKKLII